MSVGTGTPAHPVLAAQFPGSGFRPFGSSSVRAPMSDPVCLVSGVGPGTGASLARRFAAGGYRVAMLARNGERLEALESEIEGSRGYVCDVSDPEAVRATVVRVGGDLGAPTVLVHNAVGGAFGDFLEVDPERLRANFEVNVMGLLYLARALAPAMIEAGRGAIMVTGNTAARRGMPRFAGFAPTRRGSASSPSRWRGPWGRRASTSRTS